MERRIPAKSYLMHVARLGFVLLSMTLGAAVATGYETDWWVGSLSGFLFAALLVLLELLLRDLTLRQFSHGTVGLLVGLLGAWLITRIGFFQVKGMEPFSDVQDLFELVVFLSLGFLGMMLALRGTKEEFSLLIPYVRLKRDSVREQRVVVGSDALVDGRVTRLFACGVLTGELIVPRFVVDELQTMSWAKDLQQQREGKRGLDCLEQMLSSTRIEVIIQEDPLSEEDSVEGKLLLLTRMVDGRLVTVRDQLAQQAKLQQLSALHLRELVEATRRNWREGDVVEVELVREGKEPRQAVGYLEDGSMVVVNNGKSLIGSRQMAEIISVVKRGGGKLIFAEANLGDSNHGVTSKNST